MANVEQLRLANLRKQATVRELTEVATQNFSAQRFGFKTALLCPVLGVPWVGTPID